MTSHHEPRRFRGPRRATIGATLMGLSALGLAIGPSFASGSPAAPLKTSSTTIGSDIGALDVSALAAGVTVPFYEHTGEDVRLSVPWSLATLGSGGIGNALTSVMWPGGTGAHGGDTINLLGLPIPANIGQMLNDPEVAHAQTGVGDTTVDNSKPGLVMTSMATPLHVHAESDVGAKRVPVFGPVVGSTSATSDIRITGASTVTTNAVSAAHNITIAKVVKIDSVTSTARAISDGRNVSKGRTKTVVSGLRIAGVKCTLDQNGLHVPDKSLPLVGSPATKVVNTALKGAGISLTMTKVTHKIHGQRIALDSGQVIVGFGNPQYTSQSNDTGKLLIIGGATVNQNVRHGFKLPVTPPTPTPKPTHSHGGGGGTNTTDTGGGTGGTNIPPVDNVPSGPTDSFGGGPTTAPAPVFPTANGTTLPKPLSIGWIIAALIGAGLFAIGMRRLPDQVLQNAGSTCSLEE